MTTWKILSARVLVALALATSAFVPASGVEFNFISEQELNPGEVLMGVDQDLVVFPQIQNDGSELNDAVQGFQMAISHDDAFLAFRDARWQGTALDRESLNNGNGPDFFEANLITNGAGAPGITLGVVFDFEDLQFLLGAGDHAVARLRYVSVASTPDDGFTRLDFADTLGDPPILNKYTTRPGTVLSPTDTSGLNVRIGGAVAYGIHFETGNVNVTPGQPTVTIPIRLTNNPLRVYGFSFGVRYQSDVLELSELKVAGGLTSVLGAVPDDHCLGAVGGDPICAVRKVMDGGGKELGFTVAMILSQQDENVFLNPAEIPHRIFDAVFTVKGGDGSSTDVAIADGLGEPPVDVIIDLFGVSQEPDLGQVPTSVRVRVGEGSGVPFLRGDVNQDGKINVTDVINTFSFQFDASSIKSAGVLRSMASCQAVFDTDAKAGIDLTDGIQLLFWVFNVGGQGPPAAPFPNCGAPASPGIPCDEFTCE